MRKLYCLVKDNFSRLLKFPRMSGESASIEVTKRACDDSSEAGSVAKKPKSQEGAENGRDPSMPYRKKKMALLMMFCGKGYYGMQMNQGFDTIEGFLMDALLKAGVVTKDHYDNPSQKMGFQRASRTDKGVSAVGQLVSLKMFIDVENAVEKMNDALPAQIRVLEAIQVTRGFDAKRSADARSYSYTMPTFVFTPATEETIRQDYRVSEETLAKANEVFTLFKGSHNFYNYTSGRKVTDKSNLRYIMEFHVGKPFVKDDLEFVEVYVKGQSFMLHQIRKMIGMTIAVVQGLVTTEYIDHSWGPERVDVPKVPGVGLMLEEVHYSYYNKKFGHDGIHKAILFSNHKERINQFKHEFIYPNLVQAELEEKSMLSWIEVLRENHFKGRPLTFKERTAKDKTSGNSEEGSSGSDSERTDQKETSQGDKSDTQNVDKESEKTEPPKIESSVT